MVSMMEPREIIELPTEAAREFLLKRTGREHASLNQADIDALTTELGNFPLALEQAGAFIYENQTGFDDYLKSFRKRRLALLEQHIPVIGEYKETVATTWAINFAEVEKSPASADLLRLSAFLAPDAIPLELLERGRIEIGGPLEARLQGVADDPVIVDEVLKPLTSYSLVRRNTATRTYSIHPLVQEVVRASLPVDAQRAWTEQTVRLLNAAFPDPEFKNWPDCARLLSHALVAAKYIAEQHFGFSEMATLLRNTGFYLHQRGQFAQAESFYQSALALRERVCGPEHPDTADSLSKLAWIYKEQGKYGAAYPLEERALNIREKMFGPEHSETATSLNNKAGILTSQGSFAEAEPLYQRALAIKEKTCGLKHADTAMSLNNLASLYSNLGRYKEAEMLYRRSLEIKEELQGPAHPGTAFTLNNLGMLYYTQHRYAEAEPLLRRAFEIREKALGPEHPDTAGTLSNLALIYSVHDQLQEAEGLQRRALDIFEKAFGSKHPDTTITTRLLAEILTDQGRYVEAEDLFQRALGIDNQVRPNHPQTASDLRALARFYQKQQKYRLAEPLLRRALNIREITLGATHPDTIVTLEHLSSLYRSWGRVREANKYQQRVKERKKRK
jgi:tetratricopeptide (TPR) repeat protein